MEKKQLNCPYCQAHFTKFPHRCPFCKAEIPEESAKKLTTLEELRCAAFNAFHEKAISQEEFAPVVQTCTKQSEQLVKVLQKKAMEETLARAEQKQKEEQQARQLREQKQKEEQQARQLREQKQKEEQQARQLREQKQKEEQQARQLREQKQKEEQVRQEKEEISEVVVESTISSSQIKKVIVANQQLPVASKVPIVASSKPSIPQKSINRKEDIARVSYLKHPALRENLLLFLGAFLIMVGEIFVVSNAWGRLSGTMQSAGIFLILISSVLFFFFIGHFTANRLENTSGALSLYGICLFLIPLTFTSLTYLVQENIAFGFGALIFTFVVYYFLLLSIGRFLWPPFVSLFVFVFLILSAAHLAIPVVGNLFSSAWLFYSYGAMVLLFLVANQWTRKLANLEQPFESNAKIILWGVGIAIVLLEFLVHGHYRAGPASWPLFYYAPGITLAAFSLARFDRKVIGSFTAIAPLPMISILLCVLSLTIATAEPLALLPVCVLSMILSWGFAVRFQKKEFYFFALLLSLFVYFLLPYPVRSALLAWKSHIKSGLGYNGRKLPYAFYSMTFFPYLLWICLAGQWAKKRNDLFFSSIKVWFVLISTGLIGLAKSGDLKASVLSLPFYTILYFCAAYLLSRPFLHYLALLALGIWLQDIGSYFHITWVARINIWLIAAAFFYLGAWLSRRRAQKLSNALVDAFLLASILAFAINTWAFEVSYHASLAFALCALFFFFALLAFRHSGFCYLIFASFSLNLFSWTNIFYPQNATATAWVMLLWSYVMAWGRKPFRYLVERKHSWFLRRVTAKKLYSLCRPLTWLIPFPCLFSFVLVAQNFAVHGDHQAMSIFLLMSLLPVFLGQKRNLTITSCILFLWAISPLIYALNFYILWIVALAAFLYLVTSSIRYSPEMLICSLLAVAIVGWQLPVWYHLPISYSLLNFAVLSLLWLAGQTIFSRWKLKEFAAVFHGHSLFCGSVVLWGMCRLLWNNQYYSLSFLSLSAIFAVLNFFHGRQSKKHYFMALSFFSGSGAIALALEFAMPGKYHLQSLAFAVWGGLLYVFLRKNKDSFVRNSFLVYSSVSFAFSYVLAGYFILFSADNSWPILAALALCSVYCLRLGFTSHYLFYGSLFIANQAFLTWYVPLPNTILYQWLLGQTIICFLFLPASFACRNKSWGKHLSDALDHYGAVTLFGVIAGITTWRCSHFYYPPLSTLSNYLWAAGLSLPACIGYWRRRQRHWLSIPFCHSLMVVLLLDQWRVSLAGYALVSALLACVYSAMIFPSLKMRYHFTLAGYIHSALGFLLSIIYIIGIYSSPWLTLVTLVAIALHAGFHYSYQGKSFWGYLTIICLTIAYFACLIRQILSVSIYYQPSSLLLWGFFLALCMIWKQKRQKTITLVDIRLSFTGAYWSKIHAEIILAIALSWLISIPMIWLGQYMNFSFYTIYYRDYNTLLIGSTIFAAFICSGIVFLYRERIRGFLAESCLISLLATLPLFFSARALPAANWAWCGFLFFLFGHYRQRKLWLSSSLVISLLAIVSSFLFYDRWSSIWAIFIISGHALTSYSLYDQSKYRRELYFAYLTLFATAAALLFHHLYIVGEMSRSLVWSSCIAPLASLSLALSAYLRKEKSSWRIDWARFAVHFSLLLLVTLAWLTKVPISHYHFVVLCFGFALCVPVLIFLGKEEKRPFSYYLGLALAPVFYWILRFRLQVLSQWNGMDSIVSFLLFALVPNLLTSFSKNRKSRIAVNNFSLFIALAVIVFESSTWSFAVVSLCLAMTIAIYAIRMVFEADFQKKILSSGIHYLASATIVSVFLARELGQITPGWYSTICLIGAMAYLLTYMVDKQRVLSFVALVLLFLSCYLYITCDYFTLAWRYRPVLVLLLINIFLGTILLPEKWQAGKTLAIAGRDFYRSAIALATVLLGILHIIAAVIVLALMIDIGLPEIFWSRNYWAYYFDKHLLLTWSTGAIAFATGINITRYDKRAGWWLNPILFTLLVTAPLARIFSATGQIYHAPALEASLAGLIIYSLCHNRSYFRRLSFICLSASLIFTGLAIDTPITTICLFVCCLHLLWASTREQKGQQGFYYGYSFLLLIAIYFLIFYLLPKTSKPVSLVFPLLSLITTIVAFLFQQNVTKRIIVVIQKKERIKSIGNDQRIALFFVVIAFLLVGSSIYLIDNAQAAGDLHSYQTHIYLCLASLCSLAVFQLAIGKQTNCAVYYYLFQTLVVIVYFFTRYRTGYLNSLQGYDGQALLLFAISFYQAAVFGMKNTPAKTFRHAGYWLPLLTVFYLPEQITTGGGSLFFLAAIHFFLIYLFDKKQSALFLAMILLDIGLYRFWQELAIVDPQFYGIPLGITLLALAELNREQLGAKRAGVLRTSGLLVAYSSSTLQAFIQFQTPLYSLILAGICFLGIAIGVIVGNNLYIYIASSFLIVDIASYLIKYGLVHGILEGMIMVLTGIIIIAAALYFHFKRQWQTHKPGSS